MNTFYAPIHILYKTAVRYNFNMTKFLQAYKKKVTTQIMA